MAGHSRRRYDPATKARAVAIAVAAGNQHEAVEQTGVPQSTISLWLRSADNADLVAYAAQTRARACASGAAHVEEMVEESYVAWKRAAGNTQTAQDAQHLMTALGIYLDKLERMASGANVGGRFGAPTIDNDKVQALIELVKT